MRVRTDENVQTRTTAVVGKTFTAAATTKESITTVGPRQMAKVAGGLKGGARRAALGDISNAAAQTQVYHPFLRY